MTARYRKLPVEITALQWTGDNIDAVMGFMHPQEPVHVNNLSHLRFTNADDLVGIETLEGLMVASKGDWIIRGVQGELYPCKPDVFAATYEAVEEQQPVSPAYARLQAAAAKASAEAAGHAMRGMKAVFQLCRQYGFGSALIPAAEVLAALGLDENANITPAEPSGEQP